MMTRHFFTTLLLAACAASSHCGYTLAGRGSYLPAYIQRIGVPMFKNNTAVIDLDRRVTERVRSELIGRGGSKWTVVPDTTNVDAVLTGEITAVTLTPAAFNPQTQLATRYALTLIARVEFKDMRADKVLWSNPSMAYREEFEVTTATTADASAFLGQDQNALDRMTSEFARAVVSAILEAF